MLSKKYFSIHANITDKEAEQFTFPDIKYIDSYDNETSRLEWLDLRGNPAVDEDPEFGKVIEQETEIFYLYVNGLYNDNKKHYKDNYPNIQIIESDNLEDAYKKALYKETISETVETSMIFL